MEWRARLDIRDEGILDLARSVARMRNDVLER